MPRILALPLLCLIVLAPAASVAADATTTRTLNLRASPALSAPLVAVVKAGMRVTLLEPQPTSHYYHVRTASQQEGWLWSAGVQPGASAPTISRKLNRVPTQLEEERFGVLTAAACQADLSSCPDTGCAVPGTPHAIANQRKRSAPTASNAVLLTFDDFASLQQQADGVVGEHQELSAAQRASLTGLTVSAAQVSEGDLVQLVGYLVGVPHPNTGESVNCNLKGEANNDYHIPVSNDPGNTDFQGIVVEMIPQNRPPTWTLANLTQTQNNGSLVLVSGALFYDNLHFVNGDPSNPKRGQPHRFSLWEIHQVTDFVVCTKSDNSCDPAKPGDWAPLGGP